MVHGRFSSGYACEMLKILKLFVESRRVGDKDLSTKFSDFSSWPLGIRCCSELSGSQESSGIAPILF